MRIRVFADDFKSAVQKIGTVVPKKTSIPALQSARIIAKKEAIMLRATDSENYVTVLIDGEIIETGFVDVSYDDLKNIIGIKDDTTITYDAESGKIDFHSAKKSYTILGHDYNYMDRLPDYVSFDVMSSTEIPASILGNLKHLYAMAYKEATHGLTHGLMGGIHFDLENSAIVTIDGRRFSVWNIPNVYKADKFTAPGCIENILKVLIGKADGNIIVNVGKQYTQFKGNDFYYICKNIEGKYYDYRDMLAKYPVVSNIFQADGKEVGDIAKEYKKLIVKGNLKPMILTIENNIVCSGIHTATIQTTDTIESAKVKMNTGYFYAGFNPEFIIDAINFCGRDIIVKTTDSPKSPVIITDEKEGKISYILPVNIGNPDEVDFVRKQAY